MREGLVLEDADGVLERGAPGVLVRAQPRFVGPSRELAMRGELQGADLIAREPGHRRVAHIDREQASVSGGHAARGAARVPGARVSRRPAGLRLRARDDQP